MDIVSFLCTWVSYLIVCILGNYAFVFLTGTRMEVVVKKFSKYRIFDALLLIITSLFLVLGGRCALKYNLNLWIIDTDRLRYYSPLFIGHLLFAIQVTLRTSIYIWYKEQ